MLESLLVNPLATLYHEELFLIQWVQNFFAPVAPLLLLLSEHLTPAKLLDIYIPVIGVFNQQLMVLLVSALGVMNVFSSLIKWSAPANRPYWWLREYNDTTAVQQYHGTCQTTAAFPSSHLVSFSTTLYLIALVFLPACWQRLKLPNRYLSTSCILTVILGGTAMSISRIYLAAQFPHQCLLTCFFTIFTLHTLRKYSKSLYNLRRFKAIPILGCLSISPVLIYFGMLRIDMDPHWSVRMAFKWCMDPTQMRHEDSSIFVLARDFGYLTGVVLSLPIYESLENKTVITKRLPLLLVLEMLNYYARLETPKTYGRVAFVAYEFARNAMHSFTLLKIVPKLTA
ncbi:glucose-6-phosphatase catalytic subunit 1 [Bactrocera dorsalis]|uniref:glucose-6-phosphatase n=1 Tax=Bactrocera dorsalis TaxID=27457 RepID=A0A6I9V212_BACDO|nr:glucose-6-phosphatase catalytic subunit 1 [Bactrocera dorsalis]